MAKPKKIKVETISFGQAMEEMTSAELTCFKKVTRDEMEDLYPNVPVFPAGFLYKTLVRDYARPSCARHMENAVPELRSSRQFILDVMSLRKNNRINPNDVCDCCYPYIAKELQDDKEIALLALEMDKENRKLIGPTLRKDKAFILKAIELCGWLICDVCDLSFFSDIEFLKKVHKVEYDAPLTLQVIQLDPSFYENKTSADVFIARRLMEGK
jgi:hypothetical protein